MTTLAGFIALGVVLGYIFLPVPNVELVTATVFLCGYSLGRKLGFLGGTITELLYGVLNPQGMAAPFLLVSMMIAMGVTGFAGGVLNHYHQKKDMRFLFILAFTGFACTLNFAVLTTLGYLIGSGVPFSKIGLSLIYGLPFYIIHVCMNTAIFLFLVPLLIRIVWNRKQHRLAIVGILFLLHLWPDYLQANTNNNQIHIDLTPEFNYRHLGDLVKILPGCWFRDLGYNGNWANCRIQNAPLMQTEILLNGFELQDPITGMVDIRLVPLDMVSKLFVQSEGNAYLGSHAITPPILIQTSTIPSSQPYSKIAYRTGINKFSDLDITFGQKYTRRFEMLSGVLLNNEGEGSDNIHHSQQIRSTINWQPWNPLKISYGLLHNVFKSDVQYPIVTSLDTLFFSDPVIKQQRVDHMLRSTLYTGQWPMQLNWHYTNIEYRIRDKVTIESDKIQAYCNEWIFEQQTPGLNPILYQAKVENQSISADTIKMNRWTGNFSIQTRRPLISNVAADIQTGVFKGLESLLWGDAVFIWEKDTTLSFWSGMHQKFCEPLLGDEQGFFFIPTFPENGDQLTMLHNADRLVSNSSLVAEKARIMDAGIKMKSPKFHISFKGYYQKSSSVLELAKTDYNYQYQNHGEKTYYGLQSQACMKLPKQFRTTLIINYNHGNGNISFIERPKFWGNASLKWHHRFFENDLDLHVLLQVHFWSDFYSYLDDQLESVSYQYHPANILLNGKISARFMQHGIISLAVDNILDTSISFVNGYFIPGRSLRIGYIWELFN